MKNTTTTKSTTASRTAKLVKAPSKKMPATTGIDVTRAITVEQRNAMIAEAAYYIAEKNGFNADLNETYWLEAEKQIDAQILDH